MPRSPADVLHMSTQGPDDLFAHHERHFPIRERRMPRTPTMIEKGLTLVDAINEALYQEMERDDRVVALGEDVGLNGGVFRVTEGLQKRFGPERVVDTPLAE